ncbi:nucleotidyl transferase AbiEii/AbiGii toxin family protein [Clostridiaceae bacterium]|nr:nucleotidyl transferase AbiEii/AbiGii toxin family protein [Clostridiaceae bacterium]RKI07401.1 nucleotidyl transferase AbiEii/AbiGii toxin family protein [bacterium 1XD21-70]
MYLHEDRELFKETIGAASDYLGVSQETVEKDYYMTMILKHLSQTGELPCVFKGGTSLSKCFHCIDRFSEDIDITFTEHLGEARRKRLKYKILKPIAERLGLVIRNWDMIESDKDYNAYFFSYKPVSEYLNDAIRPEVKLETALISYAFPTEIKSVSSLSYEYLFIDNGDIVQQYGLYPFDMRVQSLNRTFVDKIFALCDYYIEGKAKRYSRHLYDLYKLRGLVAMDEELMSLVSEVRKHRSRLPICPSAKPGIDVHRVIYEFCSKDFYKADYETITDYFISEAIPYEETIRNMQEIADKLFDPL